MRPEEEASSGLNPALTAGLSEALRVLGESDRGLQAPPEVEARLLVAFRRRVQNNPRPQVWRWVPAVAAAAVLVIVAAYYRGPRVVPMRVASRVSPGVAPGAAPVFQPQTIQAQPGISHAPAVQITRPRAGRVPYSQPQEIATDFFPLVDFDPPMDGGELVRVSLPASAMREVGLPVREDRLNDRVQADVLVSNGMATAIRFVKNIQ